MPKYQKIAQLLVEYLKKSGKLSELPLIIRELTRLAHTAGLTESAVVTSSVKLDSATKAALQKYIQQKYGSHLRLVEKLDPDLLAGFTIQVGDEVIDTSLASKLDKIRKEYV